MNEYTYTNALETEVRQLKSEAKLQDRKFTVRLVMYACLWFVFGTVVGGTGVTWVYESRLQPAPVVVEIEKAVPVSIETLKTRLEQRLITIEANHAKMQQVLARLSTTNTAQAAQLIEREPVTRVGQDGVGTDHRGNGERVVSGTQGTDQQSSDAAPLSIQQKGKQLGLTRMVVK